MLIFIQLLEIKIIILNKYWNFKVKIGNISSPAVNYVFRSVFCDHSKIIYFVPLYLICFNNVFIFVQPTKL